MHLLENNLLKNRSTCTINIQAQVSMDGRNQPHEKFKYNTPS